MGGAKSKFEQTDWSRADGKLTGGVSDTVDGRPPTSVYGIYYLTKTGLNQREFEVTDLDKNLLYTTKIVPGTLCWFDVYGIGMNDCLLRVQVDLSRRFWVIYRMGIPCFSGQLADREATDKLALDRLEAGQDLTATPFLFRRCCVCVSWSRYMAVAMHYGPPEGVDLAKIRSVKSSTENADSNSFDADTQTTKRRSMDSSHQDELAGEQNDSPGRTQAIAEDIAENDDYGETNNTDNRPIYLTYDATKDVEAAVNVNPVVSDETEQPLSRRNSFAELTELGIAWVDKMMQDIQNNNKKKMRSDPQEGILHLDKPILLCQEIYDRLVGNHQTSRISKDRAIEYLRQDIEEHLNDTGIDPFLAGQEEIIAQLRSCKKDEGYAETLTGEASNKTDFPVEEGVEIDITGEAKPEGDNAREETEGNDAETTSGLHPKVGGAALDGLHTKCGSSPPCLNSNDENIEKGEDSEALENETLIGYWNWQNTWKIHQIKMHLARGSDLALHVCMAIIVNQVRYERNAIAMTV